MAASFEETGLKLLALVGGDLLRTAETSNPDGDEGLSYCFCGDLFARCLKQRWYQQMSEAGDHPAEHDERLACCRVCAGGRGRDGLAESAATCRASSPMRAGKVLISPGEETPVMQGGGVTSAVLSTSWATSSRAACACVAIMAWMFGGRRFVHKVWRKLEGTDGPASVRRWWRN
jgi:hypothetical protein